MPRRSKGAVSTGRCSLCDLDVSARGMASHQSGKVCKARQSAKALELQGFVEFRDWSMRVTAVRDTGVPVEWCGASAFVPEVVALLLGLDFPPSLIGHLWVTGAATVALERALGVPMCDGACPDCGAEDVPVWSVAGVPAGERNCCRQAPRVRQLLDDGYVEVLYSGLPQSISVSGRSAWARGFPTRFFVPTDVEALLRRVEDVGHLGGAITTETIRVVMTRGPEGVALLEGVSRFPWEERCPECGGYIGLERALDAALGRSTPRCRAARRVAAFYVPAGWVEVVVLEDRLIALLSAASAMVGFDHARCAGGADGFSLERAWWVPAWVAAVRRCVGPGYSWKRLKPLWERLLKGGEAAAWAFVGVQSVRDFGGDL